MTRDGGWASVLALEGAEVLGRGHVLVQALPPETPGGAPSLRGEIESLRLRGDAAPAPGAYRLRFERSEEVREIWVERWETSPSGRRTAAIRFADAALPVTAEEVSEGE